MPAFLQGILVLKLPPFA